ncbi:MAG: HAD family phosphatase [Rubrivivax sp.]|nr:HAD family phosphatase [Rubrivivax sp.]
MKKVVFDFGGVLFHWQPEAMLQREVPHLAYDEESARHWVLTIFQSYGGDWGEFDRGRLEVPDLVRRIARRTGLPTTDVLRVVQGVPSELRPIPESVALLTRLREAGRTLFFLSNMPEPYAAHLERENAFVGWFNDGIFSARVNHIKPEAAIFELAARRFGADPADLVFLDDHAPNVEQARALGWNAVHFRNAAQAETELRARGWV